MILLKMCIGLHVKYWLFLSDFKETWISRQIIEKKNINTKLHENPSSGNRFLPCGLKDRWTDMTKVIDAFLNFA